MRKIKIGWSPKLADVPDTAYLELITDTPEKVVAQKMTAGTINWCPAYAHYYKNVYAIKFPYTVYINKVAGELSMESSPDIRDTAGKYKFEGDAEGYNCQISLCNLFVSDTPYTIMETMPPILHGLREELIYLNGRYDIHAWQRPVHFAFRIPKATFEQMDADNSIIFNKGEVAMYVRFNTPNDEKVEIQQFTDDELRAVCEYSRRNTSITSHISKFSLTDVINRVRFRRPKKFLRG